jgi:F5/8 type C domain
VDLGSVVQVSSVSIDWETAFASVYKVQVSSNGTSFTDVATVSNGAPGVKVTSFAAVSARYVRVLGVTRATEWGISFWTASVFA